jgi:polyadenylate-binding protein
VKNIAPEVDKSTLETLFAEFGTINSLHIALDKDGKSRGFGFVNFESPTEAGRAVESLNGYELSGKKLVVCRAQKKEEREKLLREQFEQYKLERQKKYAGVNLYVKNLADDITDDRLRQEFDKFGSITSAKIMLDGNGKSRGFGFVCFTTPEEATRAMTDMNGRMVDAKPLYVGMAQRKDERRQQLEAAYAARSKLVPQPQMFPPQGAPMFYQGQAAGMPPQRTMIYPQQLVPRRWNPPMMGRLAQPIHYQLMPLNNNGRPPRAGRGRGGAGRTPPGKPHQQTGGPQQQQQQQRRGGAPQQQNFKYEQNVRNRNQPAAQIPHAVPAPAAATEVPSADLNTQAPLTVKELAAAPLEIQKQMLGERLFPLIKNKEPTLAGKITGMLLEMDNGELLHLLESEAALNEKIGEALNVLRQHEAVVSQAEEQQKA